jgi:hypothetical protein
MKVPVPFPTQTALAGWNMLGSFPTQTALAGWNMLGSKRHTQRSQGHVATLVQKYRMPTCMTDQDVLDSQTLNKTPNI